MDLTLHLPESTFAGLRLAPEEFVREMRIAAAVKWYELGMVSQEKAAEIADQSREKFLLTLGRFQVSPFQINESELEEEMKDAD